jgi:hypothetical protein
MKLLPTTTAHYNFIYQASLSHHNLQPVSSSATTTRCQQDIINNNNNNMSNNLTMTTSTKADAVALYGVSSHDIADRLDAMQHQEQTSYRRVDYLSHPPSSSPASAAASSSTSSPIISPASQEEHRQSRSKMCAWCYQLTDICQLSRHAVVRAAAYLDRFLASSHPRATRLLLTDNRREYQLASMTALYLAIKLHEPLSMDASLMAEISAGCYDSKEILDMERDFLSALHWRVNDPTSCEFVSLALGLLEPQWYGYDLDTLGSLLDVSRFQCELAALDYDLSIRCKASEVALAAVLNSLEGTGEELMAGEARFEYLRRLCEVLGASADDMEGVACVQVRLRRLFRRNPAMDCQEMSSRRSSRCCSQDDTMVPVSGRSSSDNIGNDIRLQADEKCTSPVSVAAVTPPTASQCTKRLGGQGRDVDGRSPHGFTKCT